MNANYVEQNQIIDRYLLGKLSEEQADEFEVLCLHDQNVLDQLELSEKMLHGFQRADEQNILPVIAPQPIVQNSSHRPLQGARHAAAARVFPMWNYATAASVFLGICLLSTITVFSQRQAPSTFEPQINTPIFELTRTRSASAEPDYIVRISPKPEWMVLSMDLGEGQVDYDSALYRAILLDQDSSVVWQGDGLEASHMGSLTLSLNSAKLAVGNYKVKIERLAGANSPVRVAEYAFQAKLRE